MRERRSGHDDDDSGNGEELLAGARGQGVADCASVLLDTRRPHPRSTGHLADAVRLGADALAVAIGVRGNTESDFIRWLSDAVRDAAPYELPVVAHIYPRDYSDGVRIVFTPEEIAYAVRVGIETGVDVIKVGYPGDEGAFAEIIAGCPVPVVMAGGPNEPTLVGALEQMAAGLRLAPGARSAATSGVRTT